MSHSKELEYTYSALNLRDPVNTGRKYYPV